MDVARWAEGWTTTGVLEVGDKLCFKEKRLQESEGHVVWKAHAITGP